MQSEQGPSVPGIVLPPVDAPRIPRASFDVSAFGTAGDGIKLDTAAIQAAIDAAHAAGGGVVSVASGTYLCGSIVLKSRVELHLAAGAVLLGSTDIGQYKRFRRWPALVLAEGQEDIAITGQGVLDGQGRELALAIDDLFRSGKRPDMKYSRGHNRPSEEERPQVIEFQDCLRVLVRGVTVRNSACWVQTYSRCSHLSIEGIRVDSDAFWNNDGIDIDDCHDVTVRDCDVDSADDGICLKSDTGGQGCENILVERCRVRSSASAVKFGTASHGGFRNVIVRDISVYDTYRSAIALESVDGGIMESIEISDIWACNTGNAFFIRLGHRNKNGAVGVARNISIRRMRVEVPFGRPDSEYDMRGPDLPFFHNPIPSSITGLPDHPVENVILEDIEIVCPGRANPAMARIPLEQLDAVPECAADYPEFSMFGELPAWGLYIRHVRGLEMRDVRLRLKNPDFRPAVVADDISELGVTGCVFPGSVQDQAVVLRRARNGHIDPGEIGGVKLLEGCSGMKPPVSSARD